MENIEQIPTVQYIMVNGLQMYCEIHGSGKPLVLLHGAFGTAAGWATLLPALVTSRQVIVIEQQGHGHTPDRDQPLTYEQMADDTAALLRHLNISKADFFGYSNGGITALGIAIRHPEMVSGLAVLGAHTGRMDDVYEPESLRQFLSLPDDFAPDVLTEPYNRTAPDPARWPVLVQKIKALGRDFAGYSSEDVAAIQGPVLIMQGDHDGVRPEHAVELFRLIPNSQVAIFPAGDHFLLWSHPDRVLSLLLPFLSDPPPSETKIKETD